MFKYSTHISSVHQPPITLLCRGKYSCSWKQLYKALWSIQKQRVEKHYWEFVQLFLRKIEIRSPKMLGLNLDRVQSVSNIIWVGYIYPCSIMRGCLVAMYVYCKHFNINNEELHKIANYLRFVGANHHPFQYFQQK